MSREAFAQFAAELPAGSNGVKVGLGRGKVVAGFVGWGVGFWLVLGGLVDFGMFWRFFFFVKTNK